MNFHYFGNPMRILILLICFYAHVVIAQHSVLTSSISTTSRGLGHSGICEWNVRSSLMNPAHLSSLEHHSVSLESYNYYFINGLYTFTLHGAYQMDDHSGFGANLISDGSTELKEWLFSLAYGRKLGSKTGIGLSIDYIRTQTPESEDLHNISVELGLQTQLLSNLLIGFVVKNPVPVKTNSLYPYPVVFKAGLNYKVYDQLQVLAEIHKQGNQAASFHCGLSYAPVKPIALSIGVNTLGSTLSMGASYFLKNSIALHTAFEHHSILGFSTAFGVNVQFN